MSISDVEGPNRGKEKKVKGERGGYGSNGRFNKSPDTCDHKHQQKVRKACRRWVHMKNAV